MSDDDIGRVVDSTYLGDLGVPATAGRSGRMTRHSIVVRLNAGDKGKIEVADKSSKVSNLQFIRADKWLDHGIGQILNELVQRRLYPGETAIDLAILAATVTAADTRISRGEDAQDSWTREIDLYLPVFDVDLWSGNARRIERMLLFLTGDLWRVSFRGRQPGMKSLIGRPGSRMGRPFDAVCLFSGGLDSFVGAIDLLECGRDPIFVQPLQGCEHEEPGDVRGTTEQTIWRLRSAPCPGKREFRQERFSPDWVRRRRRVGVRSSSWR